MNDSRDNLLPQTSFDAFKALTRKLVRVPKAEADKKELVQEAEANYLPFEVHYFL